MNNEDLLDELEGTEIAVIGMAARLPGAQNIEQFWQNLHDGVESIRFYSDDELKKAGISQKTLNHPHYVKAGAPLDEMELFDAAFFGFGPRDAAIMDPQHRHFLQCAWEALEHAGHDPERFEGLIGVYGGSGHNAYLAYNLLTNPELVESVGFFLLRHTGNDKDFLTTRVSYLLNLKGPSVNVQTACSTSLVAIHTACQSLISMECDMALAGGVTIELPHRQGYIYREGEILSPDGHCRAFDANSQGTVFGSGVGIVVLRRLADAIEAGDTIHAVIKGSAINNDGSGKVNYLAPSIEGQAAAIADAIGVANVAAESISYIETHGTGTRIGDPIEVNALTEAFRKQTEQKGFCAIGSVKTNIGHLDTAAGVAAFIKTVLALKHKQIPPTLNFEQPNPMIEFEESPFYVQTSLTDWTVGANGSPRRAGVSALGVGGTNAHVILEEAPRLKPSSGSRTCQLLALSAKSPSALEAMTANLAHYLSQKPEIKLADAAYTLQVGRKAFAHRRILVCQDVPDATACPLGISAIESFDSVPGRVSQRIFSKQAADPEPSVIFMFAGGGAQYPNMGRELYEQEPLYREVIDECFSLLRSYLDSDIVRKNCSVPQKPALTPPTPLSLGERGEQEDKTYLDSYTQRAHCLKALMFPPEDQIEWAAKQLQRPSLTLPALFMTEYALATLWMSWGIKPTAMIGHSMGEYTAACLAGVLSLPDALELVTLRGQLFETLPQGAMLSVPLSEADLTPLLLAELSIAVLNNPDISVVSGNLKAITAMEEVLAQQEIDYRRIKIAVAAHSPMLEPILEQFAQRLRYIPFNPPSIPYISNVTGSWIQPAEVIEANYWVRHLRHTVRFDDGLRELLKDDPNRIFLEVGPGKTLTSLTQMHPAKVPTQTVLTSLPYLSRQEQRASSLTSPLPELPFMLTTLGKLWAAGVNVDWAAFYEDEERQRIPLPTYPFERERYWIEPGKQPLVSSVAANEESLLSKMSDMNDWFYQPVWQKAALKRTPLRVPLASSSEKGPLRWLIFTEGFGLGEQIATRLGRSGHNVITVRGAGGGQFSKLNDHAYAINRRAHVDYERLVEDLVEQDRLPQRIVHLWAVNENPTPLSKLDSFYKNQEIGFNSLLSLTKALGRYDIERAIHLTVFTNGLQQVNDEAIPFPEKATILGPCQVIPKEYAQITCQAIDIVVPEKDLSRGTRELPGLRTLLRHLRRNERTTQDALVDQMISELMGEPSNGIFAFRDGERWKRTIERFPLKSDANNEREVPFERLREEGVYLITGGLGGIGLVIAEQLAKRVKAKLVLISRSGLPEPYNASARELARLQKVQDLEDLGAEVLVMAADVTNEAQMKAIIRQTQQRFGTIHGVIHAAGVLNDGLIQLKTARELEQVLAPKVRGSFLLDKLLADTPLDFFILFSSSSTILAPAGQVDYVAANAFMNAFAQQRSAEKGEYTVAINWGAWQQVGMAAEAAKRLGLIEPPSPPRRGQPQGIAPTPTHPLLDRCLIQSPEQIIYASQYTIKKHWILDQHRLKSGQALIPGTGYLELAQAALSQQLSTQAIEIEDLFFVAPLEVKSDEHKEIRVILQKNGTGYHFAVTSSALAAGAYGQASGEEAWQEHARAKIGVIEHQSPTSYSIEQLLTRCNQQLVTFDKHSDATPQEGYLIFGPRWQNLRQVHFGTDEALAFLALPPEFIDDLQPAEASSGQDAKGTPYYSLHPALMDMATGYGLPLIEGYDSTQDFYVPLSYKRVRVYKPLPAKIYSYLRYKKGKAKQELAIFDVTIMDEAGQALVEIDQFMLKRVNQPLLVPTGDDMGASAPQRSAQAPISSPLGQRQHPPKSPNIRGVTTSTPRMFGDLGGCRPFGTQIPEEPKAASTNLMLDLALSEGILPAEGAKAFEHVLAGDMPAQIVISSLDLDALLKEVAQDPLARETACPLGSAQPSGFSLSRPNLQSNYEAPRTEIEKTLAKFWQELLGIDEIGIHDSFFEIGGHSLIAVRLFTKIKKKYSLDLSLATLFEVPTIAQFAELVQEELDVDALKAQPNSPYRKGTLSRRWRESSPLVPIQPNGSKPPFFCVHGIHGNVLNFYHLARYLGPEQPFYGLQAQGVDGKKVALKSIEQMAALYIKEIRTIQPEGPYYLGGFSFGGEVAFEMAQQLHTEGEEVGLLALFDSVDPGHAREESSYIVGKSDGAQGIAPTFAPMDSRRGQAQGIAPTAGKSSRLRRFLSRSKQEKWHSLTRWTDSHVKGSKYKLAELYQRTGRPLPQSLIEAYLEGAHAEALLAYHPKPYPGRLTLFRADATLKYQASDPAMRWEALAQEIDLHMLYGPHEIVIEPHVQQLAQQLQGCLALTP